MTDKNTSDRVTRAVLLSAPDETNLIQAAARRGNGPDGFCATLSIADVNCTVLPKNFGVSPELRVRVNQEDVFVRVGDMVQKKYSIPKIQKLAPLHRSKYFAHFTAA